MHVCIQALVAGTGPLHMVEENSRLQTVTAWHLCIRFCLEAVTAWPHTAANHTIDSRRGLRCFLLAGYEHDNRSTGTDSWLDLIAFYNNACRIILLAVETKLGFQGTIHC